MYKSRRSLIAFIGIALIGVIAALVPAVVLAQVLGIVPEEKYLSRKFGGEYSRYTASVRRWL